MDIDVEAFLLCDAATDQQGKLNILGAFDTIWIKKLPAIHPACSIATRIRFTEDGNHSVKILIIDKDGKSIGPKLEGNMNVRIADDVDSTASNIVLNIQRLKFEEYGQYRIDLTIDNQTKVSLPFYVREIPS